MFMVQYLCHSSSHTSISWSGAVSFTPSHTAVRLFLAPHWGPHGQVISSCYTEPVLQSSVNVVLPHKLTHTQHNILLHKWSNRVRRPAENREEHCDHMFGVQSIPCTSSCDSIMEMFVLRGAWRPADMKRLTRSWRRLVSHTFIIKDLLKLVLYFHCVGYHFHQQ